MRARVLWMVTIAVAGCRDRPPHEPGRDAAIAPPSDGRVEPHAVPKRRIDAMRELSAGPGDRNKATALHQRALAAHANKDYPESERLWAAAARADPGWERPFYNLACSVALQGRADEALAYLELMLGRAIDYRRLRKLETDGDLASLRRRSELRKLIDAAAVVTLAGSYEFPRGDPPPDWVEPGAACFSFQLAGDGTFSLDCAAGFASSGEWAYGGGHIYYNIKTWRYMEEGAARQAVNDYGSRAIKRHEGGYVCFAAARTRATWPVARAIGARKSAGEGDLPVGCFERSPLR